MLRKIILPDGTEVVVSEEVYKEYMRPVWRERYHARKEGRCHVPYHRCRGDCGTCAPHAAGTKISENTPICGGDGELTVGDMLADDAPSLDDIIIKKELYEALHAEIDRLDPEDRQICELIQAGYSERQAAEMLGLPRSTYKRRKAKLMAMLKGKLADYQIN